MCPAFFSRDYISPVGDVSGAAPLKDNVLATIEGNNAEEKFFDIVKEFGEKHSQPMFVLSKLKFTEFIKYCLRPGQELDEELTRLHQAEVDFAIVHLQIGVILVEVKAAKKWPGNSLPFAQLRKGEKLIRGLLPEESGIPVHKVIALPNMDGSGFPKDEFMSLKKSDVGSCDDFSRWMKRHFREDGCNTQERPELLTLLHKLVGQKTVVASSPKRIKFTDKVREDKDACLEKILNQNFLRQSFERQTVLKETKKRKGGNKTCLPTGCSERPNVVKTADRPDLVNLSEQIFFLNMEQLGVWDGPYHQLISGVAGSGKTILLQYKALECAKNGEKVIICVPSPLDKQYGAFFAANDLSSSEVTIYTFEDFHEFVPEEEEKFHLFVDELQILCGYPMKRISLNELLLKQKATEACYCRLTYHDTQFMTSFTDPESLFRSYHATHSQVTSVYKLQPTLPVYGALCTPWQYYFARINSYSEQLQMMPGHQFRSSSLRTVMRCTEEIFHFVDVYAERSGIHSQSFISKCVLHRQFNHASSATTLKDKCSFKLGHRIRGPPVKEDVYIPLAKERILEMIQAQFKERSPKDVAVLYTCHSTGDILSTFLEVSGIPVCAVGEKREDAIVVDHGGDAHSFEWPVVFAVVEVDDSDTVLNHLIFSRAVLELFVVSIKH